MLEILNYIFKIGLRFTDALRIIFDELKHNLDHVCLAFGLAHVILSLNLYQTFVIVVFLLEADHIQEIRLF